MARSLDTHLTLKEIEFLLAGIRELAVSCAGSEPDSQPDLEELQRHASSCESCRGWVGMQQAAQNQLADLKSGRLVSRGVSCPPEEEWSRVAAGLVLPGDWGKYLTHAAQCDYCGPLLRNAADDLNTVPTRPEESFISGLQSADAAWQKQFAAQLSENASRRSHRAHPARKVFAGWSIRLRPHWTWAALAVMALSAGWMWMKHESSRHDSKIVDQLLSQAYAQKRLMELRIPGAAHSSVSILRGSPAAESAFDRPAALLEAEAHIASRLRDKPDDPEWLQARARADLIEGNRFEAAITALERVLQHRADDQATRLDLASAYFQRADSLNRPLDYGRAVELLTAVLHQDPNNTTALFNRAIVLDRLSLYNQSEADWKRYLGLDPRSGWGDEARSRLASLQERVHRQKERSSRPLLPPKQFSASVAAGDPVIASALFGFPVEVRQVLPALAQAASWAGSVSHAVRGGDSLSRRPHSPNSYEPRVILLQPSAVPHLFSGL